MTTTTAATTHPADAGPALRVALAAAVAVLVSLLCQLDHAYMAVMGAYMTLVKYEFTAFQRGLERFLGRALGIAWGLLLLWLFRQALAPLVLVAGASLTISFYLYHAGRLGYACLNFGLYLSIMLIVGLDDPSAAFAEAGDILLSIFVGVLVADVVNWLTGGDRSLVIQVGRTPLWPLRREWVAASLRLLFMGGLGFGLCRWLGLPDTATAICLLLMGLCSDKPAMLLKGRQRLLGALLGGLWVVLTEFVLLRLPHLSLLVGMVFLGTFIAAHLARTSAENSYVGVQMGLVLGMVLTAPVDQLGSFVQIGDRFAAIAIAVGLTLVLVPPPKAGVRTDTPTTPAPDAPSR